MELPLRDDVWRAFLRFQRSRPSGFAIAPLVRPPSRADGEPEGAWLERAREAARHGPLGHHTHFTGAEHARPTDPAAAAGVVRAEAEWFRNLGLEPRYWCGGGWYSDATVGAVLADFGYVDCTATAYPLEYLEPGAARVMASGPVRARLGDGRSLLVLPSTHSAGMAVRGALRRDAVAGPLVHVTFHDWELRDRARALALRAALAVLARRCRVLDLYSLTEEVRDTAPEVDLYDPLVPA